MRGLVVIAHRREMDPLADDLSPWDPTARSGLLDQGQILRISVDTGTPQ